MSLLCHQWFIRLTNTYTYTFLHNYTYTYQRSFAPHSGTSHDVQVDKVSDDTKYQNVQFADQNMNYESKVATYEDQTRGLQDTHDATLQNFFSRPIKIDERQWLISTNLQYELDPWELFFTNKRVANRLTNYHLMRCELHVKVVVNGNGFYYGRAMMGYQPFASLDNISTYTTTFSESLVPLSQLPHVFIDPTESTGGEMVLPFFCHTNSLEIPTAQWREMGKLIVRTMAPLKHANDGGDPVNVSVFAWAENVKLTALTSLDPFTLVAQSGLEFNPHMGEVDEANKTGIVSGPATTLSKWAGYLVKVPVIGQYARATEMVSGTVASVAKMFGYSRPPVTKNPEPYRPVPLSSLALTNVPDTAQKLTVDEKQELSIDTRIAGLDGLDQLNIREIASKESYLTSFDWNIGTGAETLLWNTRVSPVTWREGGLGSPRYWFPATAFAALPFQYWTGTIKYRFQIVASSFHKGRLKIVYDPNFIASNEYNTNYIRIIDIASEHDFTIEVGNSQNVSLLNHLYPGTDSVTQSHSTAALTTPGAGNGVLGVFVVNRLTSPNSAVNNDIRVNVFISAGDDFEVFAPESYFQNFVLNAQSGLETDFQPHSATVPDSHTTEEVNKPHHEKSNIVGLPPSPSEHLNCVYTGEAITSFRTMLKRYYFWRRIKNPSLQMQYGRFANFPFYRGAVQDAVDATSIGDYNFCNTVLMHWVRWAYAGWRGSVRYKLIPSERANPDTVINVSRLPYNFGTVLYARDTDTFQAPSFPGEDAYDGLMSVDANGLAPLASVQGGTMPGGTGQAVTVSSVNSTMEFEVPFQTQYRFEPGKWENYTGNSRYMPGWHYNIQNNADGDVSYDIHTAAGEDWQTFFFTGLPPLFFEDTFPAPAEP